MPTTCPAPRQLPRQPYTEHSPDGGGEFINGAERFEHHVVLGSPLAGERGRGAAVARLRVNAKRSGVTDSGRWLRTSAGTAQSGVIR